jgi:putative membrane protein
LAEQQLRKTGESLAHSAKKLEVSTGKVEDSAERATRLAADRTVLAAERTYAAWVRTGLVSLASGIGARSLLEGHVPQWMVLGMGTVLLAFSAVCFVAGVWRSFDPGHPKPDPHTHRLPPVLLMFFNGFLAWSR